MAKRAKTGGRKAGTPNKATVARLAREAAAAGDVTPGGATAARADRTPIVSPRPARGRPRLHATKLTVIVRPDELAVLDAWIAHHPDPKPTRAEAIRRLAELGMERSDNALAAAVWARALGSTGRTLKKLRVAIHALENLRRMRTLRSAMEALKTLKGAVSVLEKLTGMEIAPPPALTAAPDPTKQPTIRTLAEIIADDKVKPAEAKRIQDREVLARAAWRPPTNP